MAVVLAHGSCVGTLRYTFLFGPAAPRLRLSGSIRHETGQERPSLTDVVQKKRACRGRRHLCATVPLLVFDGGCFERLLLV